MYCPGKNQIKVFGREFEGSPFLKRGSLNNPYVLLYRYHHYGSSFFATKKNTLSIINKNY